MEKTGRAKRRADRRKSKKIVREAFENPRHCPDCAGPMIKRKGARYQCDHCGLEGWYPAWEARDIRDVSSTEARDWQKKREGDFAAKFGRQEKFKAPIGQLSLFKKNPGIKSKTDLKVAYRQAFGWRWYEKPEIWAFYKAGKRPEETGIPFTPPIKKEKAPVSVTLTKVGTILPELGTTSKSQSYTKAQVDEAVALALRMLQAEGATIEGVPIESAPIEVATIEALVPIEKPKRKRTAKPKVSDDEARWAALLGIGLKNPMGKGAYPFATKEEMYRSYSDETLAFALKDAKEARDAMRSWNPEAEGWYSDDMATILTEMKRRGLR